VIFADSPFTGRIGAIDEVGKPGGSVVVVVLVVLVVVEVVAGVEVVVASVVGTVVVSPARRSLEQAVANNARLPKIKRKAPRAAKKCVFRAKLSRFTPCTLEE
jgi:hypothetical protein